jgi:hypothetical protein
MYKRNFLYYLHFSDGTVFNRIIVRGNEVIAIGHLPVLLSIVKPLFQNGLKNIFENHTLFLWKSMQLE